MCKGTAENFNLGTTLADDSPNIAGMEHLRSFIQVNCNNLLVTCLGTTIPVDWFLDGTIQWRILNHWQTNGAEIAFQIEGDLITFMECSPKHRFGVHYTNQGRYRGNGGVAGVHNVVVIALLNFEQLLRDKMVGYSLNIRMSKLEEMMLYQHPDLQHLVELSEEKKAVIKKRVANGQTRYAVRRARAKQAEEEEEDDEEENGDYLVADEEWEYHNEDDAEEDGGDELAADDDGGGKPAAVRQGKKRGQGEEVDELQFQDRRLMVNRDRGGSKKRAGGGKTTSRKKRAPAGQKKQANKVSLSPQPAARSSRRSSTTKPSYAGIEHSEDSDSDFSNNKEN